MITTLAVCSITSGIALAVKSRHDPIPTRTLRLIIGATFLSGVMLLGLAILI